MCQSAPAPGVGCKLACVVRHFRHGAYARYDGDVFLPDLGLEVCAHVTQIAYRTTYALRRHFEPEIVPRLKQTGLRLHKCLTQRTVRRLPKIAALGVL